MSSDKILFLMNTHIEKKVFNTKTLRMNFKKKNIVSFLRKILQKCKIF